MRDDPRQAAAQYRIDRDAGGPTTDDSSNRGSSAAERAAFVENSIQQAIRRGEFDNLPGAGRPLQDLGGAPDPDWWIRRKIEQEKLTGLGPPALMLRVEDRELADRLDALSREDDVREAVADFNRRVIEARRQLLGGPPVVTALRDIDDEAAAWAERRRERSARSIPDSAPTRKTWPWWRRRTRSGR